MVPVVEAIIAASRLCAGLTGRLAARTGGSSSRCQPSAEASATSRITGTPSSAGTPPATASKPARTTTAFALDWARWRRSS